MGIAHLQVMGMRAVNMSHIAPVAPMFPLTYHKILWEADQPRCATMPEEGQILSGQNTRLFWLLACRTTTLGLSLSSEHIQSYGNGEYLTSLISAARMVSWSANSGRRVSHGARIRTGTRCALIEIGCPGRTNRTIPAENEESIFFRQLR